MTDTVTDFLVGIGVKFDASALAKANAAVTQTEKSITAAQAAEIERRIAAEVKGSGKRVTLAQGLARLIEGMEQDRADKVDAIQKEQSQRAPKRDEEDVKKAISRRDALLKSTRTLTVGMAGLVTGLAAGVTGAATGLLWATDRAAKHFERLAYAGQMSGSSATGISRVSYAVSQTGGNAEDAQQSITAFGESLKKLPALEGILKSMGIATRESNGQLRDASTLMVEYIDHLKELPQLQREARTGSWGISDTTTRAVLRDGYHAFETEHDRIYKAVGADPNAAGQGAIGFEQAMRRGFDIIGAIKTRVETGLFELFKPRLDEIAKWIIDHGAAISNVITSVTTGLTDLATAFVKSDVVQSALTGLGDGLERFAKYVASDAFKRDVHGFVDDVKALANAIRWALEAIGVLPSRSGSAAVPSPEGTGGADGAGGLGASLRNRRSHNAHGYTDFDAVRDKKAGFSSGGGPSVLRTAQQKENAAAIADEMRKAGLPEEGMAAGLGSMQTESTFNPRAHNDVKGGHTGLWQWDSTRWPKIKAWIEGQGGDPWDARWQTRAWVAEGRAKPGDALYDIPATSAGFRDIMNSKGDLAKAVDGVQQSERFGVGEEGGRAINAGKWLNNLPGASSPPAPAATSSTAPIAGGTPPAMSDAEVDQYVKDFHSGKKSAASGSAAPVTTNTGEWRTTDWRGGAVAPKPHDAAHDNYEKRTFSRYLHAAKKLAGQGDFTNPQGHEPMDAAHQKLADAMRAVGQGIGPQAFATHPLGVSPSFNQSVNNSRSQGDLTINHSPTFNVQGGDAKQNMDHARMSADRGTKDLVRNLKAVEQ